jgi:hypothetical protein
LSTHLPLIYIYQDRISRKIVKIPPVGVCSKPLNNTEVCL